jgi:G3E family GTPase
VLGADPPPEHIVIEASGVSDPAAVALALAMRPSLATRTAIDAIVTVVDAEEFPRLEGDAAALAVDQVAAADLIVINKTDRVDPAGLDAVRARVRAIAADARVVSAVHADVPLDFVLGTRAGPASTPPSHAHAHAHHDERFVSFSWSSDEALAFQALYEALRTLPASIYRGKGIVNLAEVPDRRVIVQMVGRRVTVERGAPWGREAPSTRVALIGAPDGIEVAALEQRFDACRRRVSTAPPSRMAAAVIEILRRPG